MPGPRSPHPAARRPTGAGGRGARGSEQNPSSPMTTKPAANETQEYTEETEETRVRLTPGQSSSEPPEPATEDFVEGQAESVRPEADASTDSMLSRYFRDMATHQVMGPDEELMAA